MSVLLACAACGTRGAPVSPPPGTGEVTIDMDGDWVIADLQRIDSELELPNLSFFPLYPPSNGAVLRIAGGRLLDEEGGLLYQPPREPPVRRYTNTSDGRVLLFHVLAHQNGFPDFPDCVSHFEVAAAFGSVDNDEMLGEVMVLDYLRGECASLPVLVVNPNGRYLMRLSRSVNAPGAKVSDGAGESRR